MWSGLARGIDAAAHEGALDAGGEGAGSTFAVLGSGLDRIYPPEHSRLAARITGRGGLLTEFPPGAPPRAEHFPQRNRILAAAADAVAVVEAGVRSGALITVNWAMALERPVLVAPGDPLQESARGSNLLVEAGAGMLLEAADVLAVLGLRVPRRVRAGAPAAAEGHPLLEALAAGEAHVDELAGHWRGNAPVQAELVLLELAGKVQALAGGFYALKAE